MDTAQDASTWTARPRSQRIFAMDHREAARADVQKLRARACAILTGSGTVLADDPRMNVRDFDTGRSRCGSSSIPPCARRQRRRFSPHSSPAITPIRHACCARSGRRGSVESPGADGRVDLAALLRLLAQRGVNEVHVEAALRSTGAACRRMGRRMGGLHGADGSRGRCPRLFARPPLVSLADAARFKLADVRQIGATCG